MSGDNLNWGKKGAFIGKFLLGLGLLVVMLIWIYHMNQNGLPPA